MVRALASHQWNFPGLSVECDVNQRLNGCLVFMNLSGLFRKVFYFRRFVLRFGVICGLSLLVVYIAPRGFSLRGTPVFHPPQKPTFDLRQFVDFISVCSVPNRPFATNDHMVQNPPCWRASSLLFHHWDIKTKRSELVKLDLPLF